MLFGGLDPVEEKFVTYNVHTGGKLAVMIDCKVNVIFICFEVIVNVILQSLAVYVRILMCHFSYKNWAGVTSFVYGIFTHSG